MDRNQERRIKDFMITEKENDFEVDPIYDSVDFGSIGDQIGILGYVLVRTCYACPEQYDVYDATDLELKNIRAYFRLRHGTFRATCPDVGGDTVYVSNPHGDGIFADFEREVELERAIRAVAAYYKKDDIIRITHVAIMFNATVYSLAAPNRHHNIIHKLAELGLPTPIKGIQGFLDSNGKFLTRAEAFKVALAANQIDQSRLPEHGLDILFSEDVW